MAFVVHHGRKRLFTTGKHPFVTAVRREKEYHANRGTVKVTEVERERIALTQKSFDGEAIVLSGGGHSLKVKVAISMIRLLTS